MNRTSTGPGVSVPSPLASPTAAPALPPESDPDPAPMSDATELTVEETIPTETPAESAPDPRGMPKRLRGTRDAQDPAIPAAVARSTPGRIDTALEHAKICARIASDNKAKNVLLLDMREITSWVDFFVIASASSRRQASAMGYEIDADMKKLDEEKLGIEGAEEGRWTLIDYGDFVVHLFSDEARAYYALEDVWGDAPRIDWRDEARKGGSE